VSGRSALRLGVALVIAAAVFDSPSLYVPGLALLILSLGLRAWVALAARSMRARRVAGVWSVVEGERYESALEIDGARYPTPGAELIDPLLDRPLILPMRVPERLSIEGRFERRGRHRLEPAAVRVRDPLGLRAAEVKSTGDVEVLVLPRVEPLLASTGDGGGIDEEQGEGSARGIGGAGLDSGAIEFEVDGLRPYREGTPASRIHWPTVARTGELLEYKLITGGRASPLVVLDAANAVDEQSLDKAVRAAASICFHVAQASGCAVLLPGEARPLEIDAGLRSWPAVHARLALVDADAPLARVSRWLGGETLFWVTAAPDLPRIRTARSPRARGYLVTPVPPAGLRSSFTVAGCSGVALEPALRQGIARAA
jgi:uncharacterized protein (DUF58 family)